MSTISSKQDIAHARTAQDIERKYSFGKTFAEMLGLINDNRDKIDSVESSLREEIKEQSTSLKRDTEQIVMEAKRDITEVISEVDNKIVDVSNEVKMKLDADAVSIIVKEEVSSGVERVETKSGYVFDSKGLNISKEGSEIANLIDNTGMYVKKGSENVLVANASGVDATDLHAKTYLIIGEGEGRSRFEDYGIDRTGCFWVGG